RILKNCVLKTGGAPFTLFFTPFVFQFFAELLKKKTTPNPRRKQIKKPTASYLYARLASIVPTPMGLNDSPLAIGQVST
ncbi:hypothetical protein ACI2KL_21980, partial [Pseudomonas yamanorum]|uniref:hypothetical protein n=1 Tax=Pseudomonas yamanorum TaxID=515393 RepID=UPI0038510A91